jgi:hypothetical protein
MTTTKQAMAALTAEARGAMIAAGSSKIGAKVIKPGLRPEVFVELAEWGLIGPNDGLTVAGSRVREAIMDAELAVFG